MKIKFRESFRPFAPAILQEKVHEWFNFSSPSPYMLFVSSVLDKHIRTIKDEERNLFGIDKINTVRSQIPAVTHVDNSARIQTVNKEINPRFYNLLKEFEKISKIPILINTSFNIRGEPIVCSPADAFRCFMGTEMDVLIMGNFILYKNEQNGLLISNYQSQFSLD